MGNLNIDDIRERCRDGAIRWSAHSASRMLRASDEGATVSREELGRGRYLFVRIGRKRFHLVAFS